ncbi:MAG TPA: MotA/TolQ/ExbB proton channel family protein [Bacteroidota bacterium]|nr:MotA/TolQ/ExbB proton channel family protein [Bacteroidota bacterium]
MNSTFIGYVLFAIAAYVLLIIGAESETVDALQKGYVPESLIHYIHIPGIIFVFFGVSSSMMISYNFRELFGAARALYFVYIRNRINFLVYLETIKDIAQYSNTHDIESLEDYANQIKYPFLRDGVLMLVNGYKKEEIKEILDARIDNEAQRESTDVNVFRAAARYSPGYGMLGTTVGLIQMFSTKIDAAAGFGPILQALAVAFTTTLYGLFLSNFIFAPFADKIEKRTDEEALLKSMIVEGLCLIKDKRHPVFIQDKLSSYIPQSRALSVPSVSQLSPEGGA